MNTTRTGLFKQKHPVILYPLGQKHRQRLKSCWKTFSDSSAPPIKCPWCASDKPSETRGSARPYRNQKNWVKHFRTTQTSRDSNDVQITKFQLRELYELWEEAPKMLTPNSQKRQLFFFNEKLFFSH